MWLVFLWNNEFFRNTENNNLFERVYLQVTIIPLMTKNASSMLTFRYSKSIRVADMLIVTQSVTFSMAISDDGDQKKYIRIHAIVRSRWHARCTRRCADNEQIAASKRADGTCSRKICPSRGDVSRDMRKPTD